MDEEKKHVYSDGKPVPQPLPKNPQYDSLTPDQKRQLADEAAKAGRKVC